MMILVVGLMRSGTSLVAMQLQKLGVPMGTEMRFPIPQENGQVDFEDIEWTDMMLARISGIDTSSREDFLRRIFKYSQRRASPNYSVWGVKSPFALPFVEDIKEAVNDEMRVVLTTRNVKQTYESLLQQHAGLGLLQDKLVEVLSKVKADLTVGIEEAWASPDDVKFRLQSLISGKELS